MRRILLTALLALVPAALVPAGACRAADLILNEYSAVADDLLLDNSGSDIYWGRRTGNGGDWFELVVIRDGLDVRGWQLLVVDDAGDPAGQESFALTFTQEDVWSNLRSGTIVTISEDLGANVDDYQPAAGRWWINVRASVATGGRYMTVACVSPACAPADAGWKVSNRNWQLTIKDDLGAVVFGPAGEGIKPVSGIAATEVFKLEADPNAATAPTGAYAAGTSSTFGQPNLYAGGTRVQDLSALRSVVPFTQLSTVRINEVLAHSDPGFDWVELYNGDDSEVDVGGWYLSDGFADLTRYRIPTGTKIAADGHLVLDDGDLGFALNSVCGDTVVLSAADASGLTGQRDFVEFDPMDTGVTLGRFPDGDSAVVRMSEATSAAANWLPLVGPVIVNEIMYHPPAPPPGVSVSPEFIELHNNGKESVALSTDYGAGGKYPWRITGGVNFDFALGSSLAAGGFLVVVAFDPVTDAAALAEFRSIYALDAAVTIVGPYTGKLSDFSDRVRLRKPDSPDPFGDICGGSGNPSPHVPYVSIDEVTYRDFGAWPPEADGTGPSLERISPQAPAGEPGSWIANLDGGATPGAANSSVGVPTQSQRSCMLALDADMVALARAQKRNSLGCLRDWVRDRAAALIPDDCVRADRHDLLASVVGEAELHFADLCSGQDLAAIRKRPFFAGADPAGMLEATTDQGLGLLADVLGDDLATAVSGVEHDYAAWCQVRGVSAAHRCLRFVVREFRHCAKLGLDAGSIGSVADLIECVGDDPQGRIAAMCDPAAGKIALAVDKWCSDRGVDLATAFPPCQAASAGQAATCLARSARCRACRTLDRANLLHDDCDLFDDGLSDASCR
ncbi:MAG: lamin tail domain-containing protein [Deltaproteobacteria bacterium]|nr:lamin tail domain-containing protein [Deltaproteobacteria bacterium]